MPCVYTQSLEGLVQDGTNVSESLTHSMKTWAFHLDSVHIVDSFTQSSMCL